jgi:hypothetical protein
VHKGSGEGGREPPHKREERPRPDFLHLVTQAGEAIAFRNPTQFFVANAYIALTSHIERSAFACFCETFPAATSAYAIDCLLIGILKLKEPCWWMTLAFLDFFPKFFFFFFADPLSQ